MPNGAADILFEKKKLSREIINKRAINSLFSNIYCSFYHNQCEVYMTWNLRGILFFSVFAQYFCDAFDEIRCRKNQSFLRRERIFFCGRDSPGSCGG